MWVKNCIENTPFLCKYAPFGRETDNFHTQILYFPQESVLYYLYLLIAQRLVLARLGRACYNMVLQFKVSCYKRCG